MVLEDEQIECITLDEGDQIMTADEEEVIKTGVIVTNNNGFLCIDPNECSVNQSEIKCTFTPKAGWLQHIK